MAYGSSTGCERAVLTQAWIRQADTLTVEQALALHIACEQGLAQMGNA